MSWIIALTASQYLTQAQAQRIDEELMSTYAFSIDQLMELAGLSVACVVQHEFSSSVGKPLLVVAGPGNNGGDALVAARHLKHFGFLPEILYPKETSNPLYQGAPRPPFDSILQTLTKTQAPIVSIDIPSGWDVEQGNKLGTAGLSPQILVSLTAPKLCAEHFKGKHYVGGRFVPRY
ncbi:unnamed protein product [Aphanomyces euteiches]